MVTEERTAKLHTLKVMVGFDPQQYACHLHSVEKVCQELHWLQDAEEPVWEERSRCTQRFTEDPCKSLERVGSVGEVLACTSMRT